MLVQGLQVGCACGGVQEKCKLMYIRSFGRYEGLGLACQLVK